MVGCIVVEGTSWHGTDNPQYPYPHSTLVWVFGRSAIHSETANGRWITIMIPSGTPCWLASVIII